jgi:hypothetical protein
MENWEGVDAWAFYKERLMTWLRERLRARPRTTVSRSDPRRRAGRRLRSAGDRSSAEGRRTEVGAARPAAPPSTVTVTKLRNLAYFR